MSSTSLSDKLDKAMEYIKKINEKFIELRDLFENEKRATVEMVYMLLNDLIELRNSLERLFNKYVKLLEKAEKG